MLPVKLWFINVYTYHNPKPTLTVTQIQCVIFAVVARRDKATGNQLYIFLYLLDCVLLTSTPTPTLNLPLTVMQMH